MTIEEFNSLPVEIAADRLTICCGASKWVEKMTHLRPFQSISELFEMAEKIWFSLENKDWHEAFSHHPKIGDLESLKNKFSNTASLSRSEQQGINSDENEILLQLETGNRLYEDRFGYIFIVCATGKTAEEMLALLNTRLNNNKNAEMLIATQEQSKITKLRLVKLFE